MRRKYFTNAYNSLHETLGAMDLAATIEAANSEDVDAIQALGVRLQQMLWRLVHR